VANDPQQKLNIDQQMLTIEQAIEFGAQNLTAGKVQKAEAVFQQIVQVSPKHSVALNLLGVITCQNGKIDTGVEFIKRALAVDPEYAEAHFNLGMVFQNLGELEEAMRKYQKAVALKPNYIEAHYNLATVFQELEMFDEAASNYQKVIAANPDLTEAYNNLAIVFRKMGRLDDAVATYQKALDINPDLAEAHYNIGNVFKDLGRLEESIASHQSALTINPNYVDAHINLGIALNNLGEMEEAIASYNNALDIEPDHVVANFNLGVAFQSQGQLDKAVACFQKTLGIDPNYAEAHRHLSVIKAYSEDDNDIAAMESAFSSPDLSDEQRMHLAFGLGKIFEDLQQYEKGFAYLATGNAIKRGTFDYFIDEDKKYFRNLKNLFSPKLFSKNKSAGSRDETPIFILGMPRSGTTLVEQILASHPNVYGAGELKNLNHAIDANFGKRNESTFANGVYLASAEKFSHAGSDYIRVIKERADTARFITDKMPGNFELIGMIKLMLPNAKVIHCCRDPRDTCLSIFKNYFSADGHYYAYELSELGKYHNLYRDLMKHWHNVLPGFIYDIHYEDVVADQERHSRALLEYCGLEWTDACLKFHKTQRTVRTASSVQVRKPIYSDSIQLWKRYEEWLSPLLEELQ
jgi:tetratricopeptide (TPR) repeat protein